jgi:ribosomal-protein-serine acetyltransferase
MINGQRKMIKRVDENLELRLHSGKYAEELKSLIKENQEHLNKRLAWATKDYSIERAKDFIKTSRMFFARQEIPRFFIIENDNLIGLIGLNSLDKANRSIEIGYWLDKNKTGKGIMTKCCRTLINLVFRELKFNRIIIKCATDNFKSRAIPERLGFTKERVERQSKFLHDKFEDLIVYSILKEEWE